MHTSKQTLVSSQMEVRTMNNIPTTIKGNRPPWCISTRIKPPKKTLPTLEETSQPVRKESQTVQDVFPIKEKRPAWTISSKIKQNDKITSLKLDWSDETVVQTKKTPKVEDVSRPQWNSYGKVKHPSLKLDQLRESAVQSTKIQKVEDVGPRSPWTAYGKLEHQRITDLKLDRSGESVVQITRIQKVEGGSRPQWKFFGKIEHQRITDLKLDQSGESVLQTKKIDKVQDVVSRPPWTTYGKIAQPKTALTLEQTGESIAPKKEKRTDKNVVNPAKGNRPPSPNSIKIESPTSGPAPTLDHEPIAPREEKQASRDVPQLPADNFQITFKTPLPAAVREKEIQTANSKQHVPSPVVEHPKITSPTLAMKYDSVVEKQERCESAVIARPTARTSQIAMKKPLPLQNIPMSYTRLEIQRGVSYSTSRKLVRPSDWDNFNDRLADYGLGLRKKATAESDKHPAVDLDSRLCFDGSIKSLKSSRAD